MIAFLFSHWELSGLAVGAVIAFVGVGLLGGWPLVLNRRVIGALGCVLAVAALGLARAHDRAVLMALGAQECADANRTHEIERAELIARATKAEAEADKLRTENLQLKLDKIDKDNEARKRNPHVSAKANAATLIPRGFVYDHNAALPGSDRRPAVPPPDAAAEDLPVPGVDLLTLSRTLSDNYAHAAALEVEFASAEQRRYETCVDWDRTYGTNSGCTQ